MWIERGTKGVAGLIDYQKQYRILLPAQRAPFPAAPSPRVSLAANRGNGVSSR
jgi:hypothetical protein